MVRTVAAQYSVDELKAMQKELLTKLATESEYVSSASTGAGASYSLSQRAKIEDLIELYGLAIDYLETGSATGATAYSVLFY